jgi:GTPase SAR1 family protein
MTGTGEDLLSGVAAVLLERGRDDLAARVRAAAARMARPATIVCVVGEFKQGKSLLVNALLSRAVCPVDDDLATAVITLVQHGPATKVVVVRRQGNRAERIEIPARELRDWVTEGGDPERRRGVERVVISLHHPLLARGLSIVDTPGVGGLTAGHGRATLAFLPYADALLFVTDASAELSEHELEFLRQAAERCPTVAVALTKIDLFPEWRRIEELDREHLTGVAPEVRIFPVSAAAFIAGARADDPGLTAESGVPILRASLLEDLLDRSRARARARSLDEAAQLVDHLLAASEEELSVVQDPQRLVAAQAAYEDAVRRLEVVKGAGSGWGQLLGDRMADLSSDSGHTFRAGIRQLAAQIDGAVEELKTPEAWDALGEHLQSEVAGLLAETFSSIDTGAAAVAGELSGLIADEAAVDLAMPGTSVVGSLLEGLELRLAAPTEQPTGLKQVTGQILPAVRGAYSGLMVFGFLGRILPVGAAALLMSNPVTMVIGAAFAGQTVLTAKKRNLAIRRQQARAAIRGFLDEVQFETGHQLTEVIRMHQRTLRDHFSSRVSELQRTYRDLAESTRKEAASTYEQQAARAEQLRSDLERLRGLRSQLAAAQGGAG